MKRGITVEFDYKDAGYIVKKARGTLTIEEIVQAMIDDGNEGLYFIGVNTEGFYDDSGNFLGAPKGDSVKCYSYDALKRDMLGNGAIK